jgi:hypothetical protein
MVFSGVLEIKPKQGLSKLRFGATMVETEVYFGKPDAIEHIDDIEEYKSTVWHYWTKGFSLFFDDAFQNKFSCVELDDEHSLLWDQGVFKMKEKEIIKLFRERGFTEIDMEEHEWGERRVSLDDAMVDLYFENEILMSVNYCVHRDYENILILPN